MYPECPLMKHSPSTETWGLIPSFALQLLEMWQLRDASQASAVYTANLTSSEDAVNGRALTNGQRLGTTAPVCSWFPTPRKFYVKDLTIKVCNLCYSFVYQKV